ncbi:unnamed protein product [Fusarium graminearum]|uniref:Chromosome 1, complete genome n=1 Tax=Gibberella zeae (strain ATCC MYA-4620 / CBS 123657 / FGSC 9075 / NRRL 31084 / PH-1) TaxID=229533 RepID=A0A098D0T0_GIBZE|nr:unnamed protein product [Fusarium graminearum]
MEKEKREEEDDDDDDDDDGIINLQNLDGMVKLQQRNKVEEAKMLLSLVDKAKNASKYFDSRHLRKLRLDMPVELNKLHLISLYKLH